MVWIAYRPKTRCQVWINCTTFWMIVKCGTLKHLIYYLLIKFIDKWASTVSVNLKATSDIDVNIKYLHNRSRTVRRTGSVTELSIIILFWMNRGGSCACLTSPGSPSSDKYLHVLSAGVVHRLKPGSPYFIWKNKKRSCGSLTSFLGETHQDSGVVHVKSENWESITTPLTTH